MDQREARGSVTVGMRWGGIGAVAGFLASLLGVLAGTVIAVFIGVSCGRRAAEAEGKEKSGAIAGLVGGAIAAPAFVLGASAGAVVSVRSVETARVAATLTEVLGTEISNEQAWQLLLVAVAFAALIQIVVLVAAATAAGAWAARQPKT